jgi:hypothetical protein
VALTAKCPRCNATMPALNSRCQHCGALLMVDEEKLRAACQLVDAVSVGQIDQQTVNALAILAGKVRDLAARVARSGIAKRSPVLPVPRTADRLFGRTAPL